MRLLLEIGCRVLIVIFMANTFYGMVASKTGYPALWELQEQRAALSADVDALRKHRQWMENRASLMASDDLDPDMVDERIREVLGYAAPQDIVISRADLGEAIAMMQNGAAAEQSPQMMQSYDLAYNLAQLDQPVPVIASVNAPVFADPVIADSAPITRSRDTIALLIAAQSE